jgi:AraC-binding-like domain
MVVQGDRTAVLQPGDLAVYDTRRPYTLVNNGGIHQYFFRIAISDLALPPQALTEVTAIGLAKAARSHG